MPGDRDAGASDGGGFDMLPQLEGGVVEVALFNNACKDCGVQGLVAAAARAVVAREGAVVECCAVQNVQKPNQTWFKRCGMAPSVRGAKRRAVAQCEHTAFQY